MSKKHDELSASDFKNFHVPDINIDMSDPNNYSNRVLSEQETRRRLLRHARLVGCEKDMLLLFSKADKMMKSCSNEEERKDMGKLFATQVYKLLGGGGELVVDGQIVCKG